MAKNTTTAANVTVTITAVLVPSTGKVNTRIGKFQFATIVNRGGKALVIDMYATQAAAAKDVADVTAKRGRAARNATAVAWYSTVTSAKVAKVGGQFTGNGVDAASAKADAIAKAEVALRSAAAKPAAKRAAKAPAKPAAPVAAPAALASA